MQRGELFILSAPSGSGKTTLIEALMSGGLGERDGMAFSVSHTTRAPRAGERDGLAYHFIDRPRFEAMVGEDRFLEHAEVHGNLYGTARGEVLPRLESGVDVVLDIDVQGAAQVKAVMPQAHSIFVLPPGYGALRSRLTDRALDDPGSIARRLAVSIREIERYTEYDYVIINDDARRAGEALAAIVTARRHRQPRMSDRVTEVLADFQAAAIGGPSQS
jgi:guanylate kinase